MKADPAATEPAYRTSGNRRIPEAAPSVWMDQRGNYWRVYGENVSMCPVSEANYEVEPVAVYRQGRDMSAQQMRDALSQVERATDDPLLLRVAQSAWYAWVTGRDMVTEAELLMQMLAIRTGGLTPETIKAAEHNAPSSESST